MICLANSFTELKASKFIHVAMHVTVEASSAVKLSFALTTFTWLNILCINQLLPPTPPPTDYETSELVSIYM